MAILIIEDEVKLVDILRQELRGERFTVDTAFDGETGLEKALGGNYELIILDIMLPNMDGISVCKELKNHGVHTPIIMLTARGTMEDKVAGLDCGADDYLMKPFGMSELLARIRAVLRRRKTADAPVLKIADVTIDTKKHEVSRAGKVIPLTLKEYRLLTTLVTRAGEAVTRRQLIDDAWGPLFEENNHELNVHMRYLRTKIDSHGQKPFIHTIRGVGYSIRE